MEEQSDSKFQPMCQQILKIHSKKIMIIKCSVQIRNRSSEISFSLPKASTYTAEAMTKHYDKRAKICYRRHLGYLSKVSPTGEHDEQLTWNSTNQETN